MLGGRQRWLHDLQQRLDGWQRSDLRRTLTLPHGIDFASNDYLGYGRDPQLAAAVAAEVARWGGGAAASRLLRGHLELHAQAETELAAWCGQEAALLFSSGWAANVGLVTALAGRGDTLICDRLLHASLIDAARLSGAERLVIPHGDLGALEQALLQPRRGRCLVLTEAVWSMDGDVTPLAQVLELAERYDAAVMVDEAHATGLYGATAAGRVAELGLQGRVLATVHTGGKAMGQAGAWVAGPQPLIDVLVNAARPFVFSTAVPTAIAAGLRLAAQRVQGDGERVAAAHHGAARLRGWLRAGGVAVREDRSCIVPVVIGDNDRALQVAAALQADGLDVRAVRPPTVAPGTARLRICVHADHTALQLERLAERVCHHVAGSSRADP
jgi:8-amino-7-oxononanoate synthase